MYEKLLRVFKKRTKFADKGFIVNISATVMTLEKPWRFLHSYSLFRSQETLALQWYLHLCKLTDCHLSFLSFWPTQGAILSPCD